MLPDHEQVVELVIGYLSDRIGRAQRIDDRMDLVRVPDHQDVPSLDFHQLRDQLIGLGFGNDDGVDIEQCRRGRRGLLGALLVAHEYAADVAARKPLGQVVGPAQTRLAQWRVVGVVELLAVPYHVVMGRAAGGESQQKDKQNTATGRCHDAADYFLDRRFLSDRFLPEPGFFPTASILEMRFTAG